MVVKYYEWGYKFKHHVFPAKITMLEKSFGVSDLKTPYDKEFKESGMSLKEFNAVPVNAAGEAAPEGMSADDAHDKGYTHSRYTRGQIIFYGLYFAMTGLHGFHVLLGVVVLLWVLSLTYRNKIVSNDFIIMENVGLYWHVVDLIWIYLFPVFYLVS
jgi:hypothetical protein